MERPETLGKRLRQIMKERGLNYEAFGTLLEMRPQTLNRYVLDQREPKAQVVTEMAMKLGVDAMWLQGYDVPREPALVREHSAGADREGNGKRVPILEAIHGTAPTLEEQKTVGYATADVHNAAGYFYLRAAGDGMRNAGIYPGDLVLMRKQESAKTGQIVACLIGQEDAELKRYCQQGELVILQSEHPDYLPLALPMEAFTVGTARIFGVAVRLVRDL